MGIAKRQFNVAGRTIGPNAPCYVIAEIGVNHNGDIALAKRLVDAAVEARVDAVKFQKRKLSQLYQESVLKDPKSGEQGLQYLLPLLVEFELSDEEFKEIARYCRERDTVFLCTPWDSASVDFLETLDVAAYKIGSPDMTNFPLIEYVLRTRKPIFMSTGMSTEAEIRRTLEFLKERDALCALFHCVSNYPAAPEEINLRFMQVLREWTGWPVGYSGHDVGTAISLAAVAMGANLLERHLTLDRSMRGPDHAASLEPAEFSEQVRALREVEAALGVAHRWMTRGEVLNRRTLAKSLVAARDIEVGEIITSDFVTAKGPGLGLSPQYIGDLVGRASQRKLRKDDHFLDVDIGKSETGRSTESVDPGLPWGMIARFHDLEKLLPQFEKFGMSFIEFHVSDRDLDQGIDGFKPIHYPFELVVHAPEYFHDELIDFCSVNAEQRRRSVERINQTIELVRRLKPWFKPSVRGPKLVFHIGGMSQHGRNYDVDAAHQRAVDSIRQLNTDGVEVLLENLPPYPWYFGGRWFGHVLVDAESTVRLCETTGLGLCFDTSHAGLECNRSGSSLADFARRAKPFLRHLHVSDAAGTSGEGLQIGEGQINFVELMPIFTEAMPTMVPEIWMGHHENGRGFLLALEHLTDIVWAGKALARAGKRADRPELKSMVVPSSATVLDALRAIDLNRMGIAFVIDENGIVLGVVTDGDIRHGIVAGKSMRTPITDICSRDFIFGTDDMRPEDLRKRLPGRSRVMPILDSSRRLIGLASDLHILL